jgi:hypothetical protein
MKHYKGKRLDFDCGIYLEIPRNSYFYLINIVKLTCSHDCHQVSYCKSVDFANSRLEACNIRVRKAIITLPVNRGNRLSRTKWQGSRILHVYGGETSNIKKSRPGLFVIVGLISLQHFFASAEHKQRGVASVPTLIIHRTGRLGYYVLAASAWACSVGSM